MDLIDTQLSRVPIQVRNIIHRKLLDNINVEGVVRLMNLDLVFRNVPPNIRELVIEKAVGIEGLAEVCSTGVKGDIDFCRQSICEKALKKAGFISYEGIREPIDYCSLCREINKLKAIMTQYTHNSPLTNKKSLSYVITFVNKHHFYNQCSREEIESVSPELIEFILRNNFYMEQVRNETTGEIEWERKLVKNDQSVIAKLKSQSFKDDLIESPRTIKNTLKDYLDEYYVPQAVKDDLLMLVANQMVYVDARIFRRIYKDIFVNLVRNGANIYKIITPLAEARRGRIVAEVVGSRNSIYEAMKEAIIYGDDGLLHDILIRHIHGSTIDAREVLKVPELLALSYTYEVSLDLKRYLLSIATEEDIHKAQDIYESAQGLQFPFF